MLPSAGIFLGTARPAAYAVEWVGSQGPVHIYAVPVSSDSACMLACCTAIAVRGRQACKRACCSCLLSDRMHGTYRASDGHCEGHDRAFIPAQCIMFWQAAFDV